MKNTSLFLAFAFVCTLASFNVPSVARACGGYGVSIPSVEVRAAMAAQLYAEHVNARHTQQALALVDPSARASVEYRGCCQGPAPQTVAEWLEERFRGAYRLEMPATATRDGNVYRVSLRVHRAGRTVVEMLTLQDTPHGMRITSIYEAHTLPA